ncbi:MAG: hypothetical protein AAF198_11235 [Pseudomonadota bacterium]
MAGPTLSNEETARILQESTLEQIDRGETIFRKCAVCHNARFRHGAGPYLNGIVGASAARLDGFRYSRQFSRHAKDTPFVWKADALNAMLSGDPKWFIGNACLSIDKVEEDRPWLLKDAGDRQSLIAFLATLEDE